MKYTQIPTTAFQEIQLNAGILVESFEPTTGTIGRLLGATTGGVQFQDNVSYTDFGEDIDNCPKNTMELKKVESHEVTMSGTFVTLSPATAKMLAAIADVDAEDSTHIIPRNDLLMTDFIEVWWIGDYSDQNTGDNAGFVAIKMFNALNTGGFQIQSADKAKGQFAFTFTGHYSMDAQDLVPYEIYIKGNPATDTHSITQTLTHITSSLSDTTIDDGEALEATLTADTDYQIDTVTVSMGGTDITSTAWDSTTSKVSIASVTGDVVITAVGSESL